MVKTPHPQIDKKTRRELVRTAAKRPIATLENLQEFLAATRCVLHVVTPIFSICLDYGYNCKMETFFKNEKPSNLSYNL